MAVAPPARMTPKTNQSPFHPDPHRGDGTIDLMHSLGAMRRRRPPSPHSTAPTAPQHMELDYVLGCSWLRPFGAMQWLPCLTEEKGGALHDVAPIGMRAAFVEG